MFSALLSVQVHAALQDDQFSPPSRINKDVVDIFGTHPTDLKELYTALRVLSPVDISRRKQAHAALNDIVYKLLRTHTGPLISHLLASTDSVTNHVISNRLTQFIIDSLFNQAIGAVIPGFPDLRKCMISAGLKPDTSEQHQELPFFIELRMIVISVLSVGGIDYADFRLASFAADPAQGDLGGVLQRFAGQVADQMQELHRHPEIVSLVAALPGKMEENKRISREKQGHLNQLISQQRTLREGLDEANTEVRRIVDKEATARSSSDFLARISSSVAAIITDSEELVSAKRAKDQLNAELERMSKAINALEQEITDLEREAIELTEIQRDSAVVNLTTVGKI